MKKINKSLIYKTSVEKIRISINEKNKDFMDLDYFLKYPSEFTIQDDKKIIDISNNDMSILKSLIEKINDNEPVRQNIKKSLHILIWNKLDRLTKLKLLESGKLSNDFIIKIWKKESKSNREFINEVKDMKKSIKLIEYIWNDLTENEKKTIYSKEDIGENLIKEIFLNLSKSGDNNKFVDFIRGQIIPKNFIKIVYNNLSDEKKLFIIENQKVTDDIITDILDSDDEYLKSKMYLHQNINRNQISEIWKDLNPKKRLEIIVNQDMKSFIGDNFNLFEEGELEVAILYNKIDKNILENKWDELNEEEKIIFIRNYKLNKKLLRKIIANGNQKLFYTIKLHQEIYGLGLDIKKIFINSVEFEKKNIYVNNKDRFDDDMMIYIIENSTDILRNEILNNEDLTSEVFTKVKHLIPDNLVLEIKDLSNKLDEIIDSFKDNTYVKPRKDIKNKIKKEIEILGIETLKTIFEISKYEEYKEYKKNKIFKYLCVKEYKKNLIEKKLKIKIKKENKKKIKLESIKDNNEIVF